MDTNKDIDALIDELELLIRKGKDSYFIDQELKKHQLTQEQKGEIIQHLQEYEIEYIKSTSGKNGAIIQAAVGLALIIVGYLGTFDDYSVASSRYIIKVGAIIGGGFLLWKGYRRYKKITSFAPPNKFRQQRFKRYE